MSQGSISFVTQLPISQPEVEKHMKALASKEHGHKKTLGGKYAFHASLHSNYQRSNHSGFFFLTSLSSLLIPKRPDSNFNQPRVTFAMFPLRIVRASVVVSGAHNLLPLENEGLAPKNL